MALTLSEAEFDAIVLKGRSAQLAHGGMSGLAADCRLPQDAGRLRYIRTEWAGQVKALSAEFDLEDDLEVHLDAGRDILITFFLDGGIEGATGDGRRALDFRVRRAMLRLPNSRDGFVVRIPARRRNAFVQLRVDQGYFNDWLKNLEIRMPREWADQLRGRDGRVLHNAVWTLPTQSCLNQINYARLPPRMFLPYFSAKSLELLTLFTHELGQRGAAPAADRTARAEELLTACLADAPTIPALARELAWNATDLKAAFRTRYGASIHAYLRSARLAHAAMLLKSSQLSIYAVAQESGWRCQSRFGQAFKATFGMTPGNYRKRRDGAGIVRSA